MTDELRNPAARPNYQRNLVRGVGRGGGEVLEVRCCADQDGGEEETSDWLEKDVEEGVVGCGDGAGVEVEVGDCEPGGEGDEGG